MMILPVGLRSSYDEGGREREREGERKREREKLAAMLISVDSC